MGWKPIPDKIGFFSLTALKSDHSGMETYLSEVYLLKLYHLLKSDHCGMETSCSSEWDFMFNMVFMLKSDHCGMETYIFLINYI